MKTKIYFQVLIAVLLTGEIQNANSQSPAWQWANSIGSIGANIAYSVISDADGNVYTTGFFVNTVDFDPGPNVFNLSSNTGSYDVFILKLDGAGNFVWAKQFSGSGNDVANKIISDDLNFIYLTGWFSGMTDFDPGSGVTNLTAAGGGNDIFVTKLDSAGNLVWAKAMTGFGLNGDDEGRGIALDGSYSVYTTGSFHGKVDFDPGNAINFITTNGNVTADVFISKLDSAGNFVWARSMGGVNEDKANDITIDASGSIYTIGEFQVLGDFDPDTTVYYQLLSSGSDDIFISKLNRGGNFVWAKTIRGLGQDNGTSIVTDAVGNVYTTGSFQGTDDFDPGNAIVQLTAAGSTDQYISKWDSAGNYMWAKAIGGSGSDVGKAIAIDLVSGSLYTGGFFSDSVDFNPAAAVHRLISQGGFDAFASAYDSNGNFLWAKEMGGTDGDVLTDVSSDSYGNPVAAGYYYSASISFDGNTLTNSDVTTNTVDMFVSKIDITTTGIIAVQNNFKNEIIISPNPSKDKVTIQLLNFEISYDTKLIVLNSVGQKVMEISISNPLTNVNLGNLSRGIYLFALTSSDGKTLSNKVVVE